jgi:hypothetical protein
MIIILIYIEGSTLQYSTVLVTTLLVWALGITLLLVWVCGHVAHCGMTYHNAEQGAHTTM